MRKALTIVLLVLLIAGVSEAQNKFKFNVIGGYSLPLPDLKGTYPTDSNSYFMSSGFNVGGVGKYYVDQKNSFGITLSIVYNAFTGKENTVTIPGGSYTMTPKVNNFQIGLGAEYLFINKSKVNPFVGGEFTANFFSGNTKFAWTGGGDTYTLKSATRFGFNIGAGVDIAINPGFSVVIGGKYQLMNLIGKDSTGVNPTAKEYGLDDKEMGGKKASNISAIQIYGGINLNLDILFRKK